MSPSPFWSTQALLNNHMIELAGTIGLCRCGLPDDKIRAFLLSRPVP
jgi:hypothetical protein